MAQVIHLTGPILTHADPDRCHSQAWVIGGKITFERPQGDHEVTTISGWVLPGMVDAHCHVGLGPHGGVSDEEAEQQAIADRDSGTLLIRDAGSPVDTRWVNDREDLPKLIRAGRHIARTRRYIRNYAHEIEPPQLPEMMAAQAQLSDGWVKIVGDWIDRERGDLGKCWPDEAVHAGIAAAHAHGAKVTAHCFAEESLLPLVEAGIDCVEHATGLTEDHIPAFVDNNVAIVPTLVNILTFPDIAAPAEQKFPAYFRHMNDLYDRRYATIGAAYEAGIAIYAGTDAGGVIEHGLVPDEVAELTRAGLPNLAALDAAMWSARAWLGKPGIEEGEDADVIVFSTDPREDVAALKDPQAVILRGKTVARAG